MAVTYAGIEQIVQLCTVNGTTSQKIDTIALGAGTQDGGGADITLSPLPGDTTLENEFDNTNAGGRKVGTDVTDTLETTGLLPEHVGNTARFEATWTFTGAHAIKEVGLFSGSDATVNAGTLVVRQVFADAFNVIADDVLTLTVDLISKDLNDDRPNSVVTTSGIEHCNKLILGSVGANNTATDGTGAISVIALGHNTGATTPEALDTALDSEIPLNHASGLYRSNTDPNMSDTTVTTETSGRLNDGVPINDTIRVERWWIAQAPVKIQEAGLFNVYTESSGVMFVRAVFDQPLHFIETDKITVQMNLVHESSYNHPSVPVP